MIRNLITRHDNQETKKIIKFKKKPIWDGAKEGWWTVPNLNCNVKNYYTACKSLEFEKEKKLELILFISINHVRKR